MLKRLFSKKLVHGTNKQGDGNPDFEHRMSNEDRKSTALKPLGIASNKDTCYDKENNPVTTYTTKERKDMHHSNRDLELKCCLCSSSDCFVKAAGYCTVCKQFVCVSCIEWHYTKVNMKDHIMLQLVLITKNTIKENPNWKTDYEKLKEMPDKINDDKEIEGTDDDPTGVTDVNEDILKVKDINTDLTKDTNEKKYLKAGTDCDKGVINVINEDKQVDEVSSIDKGMKGTDKHAKHDNNVDTGVDRDSTEVPADEQHGKEVPEITDVDKHTEHDVTINGECEKKEVTNSNEHNKEITSIERNANESCNGESITIRDMDENAVKFSVPEKFSFVKDVKVKYEGDSKNCFISGIAVLSDKRIAVLDHNNKNIKTLHTDWGIDGVIQFSNCVGAMTSLPSEQIAVTIPQEKRIKLLSTINEISVVANIRFLVEYYHIVYCKGKLLVSLHEPLQFRLLGLDGILLQKVIPSPDVAAFITTKEQMHLAISQDEKLIYVSNTETNTLVAVNMDGALVTFRNTELEKPSGIMVANSDELYVCNRDKHTVHKMTKDFTESPVMISKDDGLLFPYCIGYYPDKSYLFISSKCDDKNYCNNIKMFKSR